MKKLLKQAGIHKPDEMERYIVFRAQRNSYIFLISALIFWSFYESYRVYAYHTKLNLLPCMLLLLATVIQGFSQLLMTRNAVREDAESNETAHLLKTVVFIGAAASIVATIITAIIFTGVKL